MDKNNELEVEQFLNELTELTKKYGLAIGGCGCCGSPWLDNLENDEVSYDNLCWNYDDKTYKLE